MIYEVTQFGLPKNIAAGVTEALRQMQRGDTLHFPKGEYHFYKDYCQSLSVHTSNTDSFQRPKKTFGILLQDKEQLTLDGDGSVFVFHGNISALGVLRCRQITLRNFTIRYACPTNVELEVTAKQGHTVSYRVPENQPFYMDGGSVVFFEQSPFTKKNYWQMRNNENSSCAVRHQGETVFREVDQPFSGLHRTRRTGRLFLREQRPCRGTGDGELPARLWLADPNVPGCVLYRGALSPGSAASCVVFCGLYPCVRLQGHGNHKGLFLYPGP